MPLNPFDYPTEIEIDIADVKARYPEIDSSGQLTDNIIKQVSQDVWDWVNDMSTFKWRNFPERLSEHYLRTLQKAVIEQIRYELEMGGSLKFASGINESNGAIQDLDQLQLRIIAPSVQRLLISSGLVHSGLGNSR